MRKLLATWRAVRTAFTLGLALSVAASAAPVLTRAWQAAVLLAGERDHNAIAAYRLAALAPGDYAAAIDAALTDNDPDLAASLLALAGQQGVTLPADTSRRVADAVAAVRLRAPAEAWDGFLSGEAESEAALAGAIAADLSGFGDVRDLYREASAYLAGEPVDQITLAFAAVGLSLTAATVVTIGAATPAKAGVSTIKAAHRVGRLSPALARQLGDLAVQTVNRDALGAVARALRAADLSAARTALKGILRADKVDEVVRIGDNVATIGANAGYRGTLRVLGQADNADDVARSADLARTYGRGTRGTFHVLGHAALTFASVAWAVLGWLASALLWLAGALWSVWIVFRWGLKKLRPPAAFTTGGLSAPRTPRGYLEKG